MTDQELKDLVAGLAVKSDKMDTQRAEDRREQKERDAKLDALIAESTRKLEAVGIRLGNMGQNQGAEIGRAHV